jgi:hypothetical protein
MNIKDILSIAGKPGLYRLVAQSKSSIIVEALENKKRLPVNATQKISSLADISIYTFTEDVPLKDVLAKIKKKENGGKAIDHKAAATDLRRYMEEVMPDYDAERVYDSDLRKLFQWYNLLLDNGRLEETEEPVAESAAENAPEEAKVEEVIASTPQAEEVKPKKPRAKKATAAKKTDEAEE